MINLIDEILSFKQDYLIARKKLFEEVIFPALYDQMLKIAFNRKYIRKCKINKGNSTPFLKLKKLKWNDLNGNFNEGFSIFFKEDGKIEVKYKLGNTEQDEEINPLIIAYFFECHQENYSRVTVPIKEFYFEYLNKFYEIFKKYKFTLSEYEADYLIWKHNRKYLKNLKDVSEINSYFSMTIVDCTYTISSIMKNCYFSIKTNNFKKNKYSGYREMSINFMNFDKYIRNFS